MTHAEANQSNLKGSRALRAALIPHSVRTDSHNELFGDCHVSLLRQCLILHITFFSCKQLCAGSSGGWNPKEHWAAATSMVAAVEAAAARTSGKSGWAGTSASSVLVQASAEGRSHRGL